MYQILRVASLTLLTSTINVQPRHLPYNQNLDSFFEKICKHLREFFLFQLCIPVDCYHPLNHSQPPPPGTLAALTGISPLELSPTSMNQQKHCAALPSPGREFSQLG